MRQAKTKGRSGKGLERAEPGLRERQLKKEAFSHRKDLTFSHVGRRSGEGSREEAWLPEGSERIVQFAMNCDGHWGWG